MIFAPQAMLATWVSISPNKRIRTPCHTNCHPLPNPVKSGVKFQYCRGRAFLSDYFNKHELIWYNSGP